MPVVDSASHFTETDGLRVMVILRSLCRKPSACPDRGHTCVLAVEHSRLAARTFCHLSPQTLHLLLTENGRPDAQKSTSALFSLVADSQCEDQP